jgi:hypothetical protein
MIVWSHFLHQQKLRRQLDAVLPHVPIGLVRGDAGFGDAGVQEAGLERPGRRLIVLRQRVADRPEAGGKTLLEVPGYRFQALVSNLPPSVDALGVWRPCGVGRGANRRYGWRCGARRPVSGGNKSCSNSPLHPTAMQLKLCKPDLMKPTQNARPTESFRLGACQGASEPHFVT